MATEEQVFSLPWPDTSDPGPQIGDGRPYTDGEWRNVWRTMILGAKTSNAGVFNVPDDAEIGRLEVTSPGANQISVATGAACVDGLFVSVDTPVDLTPPSAGAGSTRQDRVVLRATWGAGASQYITVVAIKQGTQAAPPSLTQIHNSTWEISLARYTINDVGAISGLENERVYAQSVMRHEFEAQEAAFAAHQGAATLDHPNNSVTNAKLRDSASLSVIGRASNSSGDPADIVAGANDRFLARVANALQWVRLTIGMIPDQLITEAKLAAAVAAKLVTNGNSHDHSGGDGAQIDHVNLANKGTNTHAQIDGHISATSAHSATSSATANRLMLRNASGRAKVAAPSDSDDIARKAEVDAVQSNLNTHTATVNPHSATSSAWANRLMLRDADGRCKVAAPSASSDIARKAEVDAVQSRLTSHSEATSAHSATSAATANRIMMRDASGRAKVAAPSASSDIARKAEVDAVQSSLTSHSGATSAHSATSAATANRIMMRDASGRAKVAAPSASSDIARKAEVDAVSSALNTHKSSSDHDARYALAAKGVTNGNSHDHVGGDGATLTHQAMANRTRSFFVPAQPGELGANPREFGAEPGGWAGVKLPDGIASQAVGYAAVPEDFVSNMQATPCYVPGATGSAVCVWRAHYCANGETIGLHTNGQDWLALSGTPLVMRIANGASLPSAAKGDVISFVLTRFGDDPLDTMKGYLHLIGWRVTYTADM